MEPARCAMALASFLLLAALVGCDGRSKLGPEVTVVADWTVSVAETADTCDAAAPQRFLGTVTVAEYEAESEFLVYFEDDATGMCWVMPFQRHEDVLTLVYGGNVPHACHDGCRVLVESEVSLTFSPGGRFSGTETLRFTPLTAECAHPSCAFPCDTPLDHPLHLVSRRCAFDCTTTYSWTGAVCDACTDRAALRACG